MTKKVFHIEKSCIFATSLREMLSLMQHVDNKPFRRAFGSILEGRFPLFKEEIRNALRSKFRIRYAVFSEFEHACSKCGFGNIIPIACWKNGLKG